MYKTDDTKQWQDYEIEVAEHSDFLDELFSLLKIEIIGQENLLEKLVIGLLGNGHILLEGMPGLAKTLAAKTLAQSINAGFNRIQFTPDILPADILGTMIYNIQTNEFSIKKGPVFSNFVLADEINRAPEKVQSALLEAMQEHQVTIGNNTYPLRPPFMVIATQNPIDQAGTYELPEAQMDRFMLKVLINSPSREEERSIIRKRKTSALPRNSSIPLERILKMQELVENIFLDQKIEDYILDIIFCTRLQDEPKLSHLKRYIKFGSSPRGSINLVLAAKAHAFLKKRSYVTPDDVAAVAFDVLRHRIGLNYTAMAENITTDFIIQEILKAVPIP